MVGVKLSLPSHEKTIMTTPSSLILGATADGQSVNLHLPMANRHGLVTGATGTGKTVTLQVLAEAFSRAGVPVFAADVKGDLSGISQAGTEHPKVTERLEKMAIPKFRFGGCPTLLWDIEGKHGHPVRTTVSEMGPLLLSRLMDLSDTQSGILQMIFQIADDQGLLLLDLKDLQSLVAFVTDNAKTLKAEYGSLSTASLGVIQRQVVLLRDQGGDEFFGEPALKLSDLMRTDFGGRGVVSLLDARTLMQNPKTYSTFLLWLIAELFETLPEVGDPEKPRCVFFFDEAHLLFNDAPKVLLEKIDQLVRLIRSKGVGIYFVTQNALDVPESVRSQLGNRVQHALRAFTPKDQKTLRVVAESFRANAAFDAEEVIPQLEVGEALISCLEPEGDPSVVQRVLVRPPESRIGPATPEERAQILASSPLQGTYDEMVDRASAYEMLQAQAEASRDAEVATAAAEENAPPASGKEQLMQALFKGQGNRQSIGEAMLKTAGRQLVRGLMKTFLK